jgi:hypothetical protein
MGLALLDYLLCCSFLKILHNDVFVVLFSVHGFAFKIAVFLIKQMIREFSIGLEGIILLQTSKTDNNALDIDAIYNLKLRKT